MSLDSLLTLPGFLIVVFLNPTNAPNHTLGMHIKQYITANTSILGNDTTVDVLSSQFAKFIMLNITNTNDGKANDTNSVHNNQLLP